MPIPPNGEPTTEADVATTEVPIPPNGKPTTESDIPHTAALTNEPLPTNKYVVTTEQAQTTAKDIEIPSAVTDPPKPDIPTTLVQMTTEHANPTWGEPTTDYNFNVTTQVRFNFLMKMGFSNILHIKINLNPHFIFRKQNQVNQMSSPPTINSM